MTMILMSHPDHGFTHVYDEAEKAERLTKGWKIEAEYAPKAVPAQDREEKPKRKYTRKVQA